MRRISPDEALAALHDGAQAVDIREDSEHDVVRVEGMLHAPFSHLHALPDLLDARRPVVLICKGGVRSVRAADYLEKKGFADVASVEGGIDAWIQGELPIIRGAARGMSVWRQVNMVIGLLAALGAELGARVHPGFYALPAFIGIGLSLSGATGFCGLFLVLMKMPWNRSARPGARTCKDAVVGADLPARG